MAVNREAHRAAIRGLVDETDLEGFSDLAHLNKRGLNLNPFRTAMLSNDKLEASPIPLSFLLARSILQAHANQRKRFPSQATEVFADRVRIAVFTSSHMTHAREIDLGTLQAGLAGIKMREDTKMNRISTRGDERKQVILIEWPNLAFAHIPQDTLDPLWDLFDMDSSPFVLPSRFNAIGEDGYPTKANAPILVGKRRNRRILEEHEARKALIPSYTMGHWGAAIHISVLLTPVSGDATDLGLLPTITEETVGDRPPAPGDTWVVLTYEPPTIMLDIQNRLGPQEGTVTIGDEEVYS
jgi:hypothetical protein